MSPLSLCLCLTTLSLCLCFTTFLSVYALLPLSLRLFSLLSCISHVMLSCSFTAALFFLLPRCLSNCFVICSPDNALPRPRPWGRAFSLRVPPALSPSPSLHTHPTQHCKVPYRYPSQHRTLLSRLITPSSTIPITTASSASSTSSTSSISPPSSTSLSTPHNS